jgi:hypothetical protein
VDITTTQAIASVLVLAGLVMIGYQMFKTSGWGSVSRGASFDRSGFKLKTTFPGIIVLGLGVFVLVIGSLTGS